MDQKGCYTPKLPRDLVRGLWQLKQKVRRPMTCLIAEAVEVYLAKEGIK